MLRISRSLAVDDFLGTIADIKRYVRFEEQFFELLGYLPLSKSGVGILVTGLFHADEMCRRATLSLLMHIATFQLGQKLLETLNFFLLGAYQRAVDSHNLWAAGGVALI
jgi:hypothetical protein